MADRVLVVDDEQSLRKVLAATLQREGYEVTVCGDGEEAIAALERDGADVVVTDLVMPRMDGLALLRKVVARHPDVPVIVVTAHGRIDSAVEAMKAGAFDFLAKPFDHEDLKAIIAKAARQSDYNQRNVVPNNSRGVGSASIASVSMPLSASPRVSSSTVSGTKRSATSASTRNASRALEAACSSARRYRRTGSPDNGPLNPKKSARAPGSASVLDHLPSNTGNGTNASTIAFCVRLASL